MNFGIDFKGGTLIGRLDCGDVCHKNKFTKQINYLQANEDVKLLGCWVRVLDESNGFKFNLRHSEKYEDIKKKMYLNSTFVHPTVVFRAEIINVIGKYPTNRKAAEDYAFFFKVISRYKAENYPEILLDYEMSKQSISNTKRKLQVYNRIRIIIDNFYFGLIPTYAIARNLVLLIIPVNILTFMKSKIYR